MTRPRWCILVCKGKPRFAQDTICEQDNICKRKV